MKQKKDKILLDDYFIENKIPFLAKGMEINDEDESHLKKWGFDLPSLSHSFSTNDTRDILAFDVEEDSLLKLSSDKLKDSFDSFTDFDKQLAEVIEIVLKIIQKSKYELLDNSSEYDAFISLVNILQEASKSKEEFILYLNSHFESTPENITGYTLGLTAVIGQEMKASREDMQDMFFATILSNIFFLIHSSEKIKLMMVKEKPKKDNPTFSQHWINYIVELIKKTSFPIKVKYLIVYQNAALDGSGIVKADKIKITAIANLMGLVRTHVWQRHPFSTSLYRSRPYSIVEMVKEKNKYYKSVLSTFLTTVGMFEAGSVIHLQSSNEAQLALVIRSNGIKKPTVKIILNHNKQIDYSKDLLDLNDKDFEKWKITLVENSEQIERVLSIFKNNIDKGKYTI